MRKTAYELRISDWSSDVCSSYLVSRSSVCVDSLSQAISVSKVSGGLATRPLQACRRFRSSRWERSPGPAVEISATFIAPIGLTGRANGTSAWYAQRSEEHTSELQSLMRISNAVFCLKKKN